MSTDAITYDLDGLRVEVAAPVEMARGRYEHWYPQVQRFGNGDLLGYVRVGGDYLGCDDALLIWSADEGRSWSEPKRLTAAQSTCHLLLPDGRIALLPFHTYRRPSYDDYKTIAGPITLVSDSRERRVERIEDGLRLGPLPRPAGPINPIHGFSDEERRLGLSHFYLDGHAIPAKDGGYLATCYGTFAGGKDHRFSAVLLESKDARAWTCRAIIADDGCELAGVEGPCEPTLCRLKDGRLMCVFRLDGYVNGWFNYGQCFSEDDGKTWSKPVSMPMGSAEPRLLTMRDGTVLLLGGRPDLYLWIDPGGTGTRWQQVDVLAHHNRFRPDEPIRRHGADGIPTRTYGHGRSSGYAHGALLEDDRLVFVYDRTPPSYRWAPDGQREAERNRMLAVTDPAEMFTCWIVQVTVRKQLT